MEPRFTIVGLGEALFDIFPDAQILGGAPLNVAIAAHQLAATHQGRGLVVSRVGQDPLGNQIIDQLAKRDIVTDFVQTDPDHATGRVFVSFDQRGQPQYEIVKNAAWDVIQFDPDLERLARHCDAVCFGSLAQRTGQSRSSIRRFLDTAPHAIRLFDVNLRQDYFDQRIIRRSCQQATVVKLNNEELPRIVTLLGITASDVDAQVKHIVDTFELKLLVLTRGTEGTALYSPTDKHVGDPVSYPLEPNADSVGAGDACTAAIIVGLVLRKPLDVIVSLANHAGAFVASQPGATPALPQSILDLLNA